MGYSHIKHSAYPSGMQDKLFIAPVDMFYKIADTVAENDILITSPHQFIDLLGSYGFIKVECMPGSVRLSYGSSGKYKTGKKIIAELNGKVSGMEISVLENLQLLQNDRLIVLTIPAKCSETKCFQLGTKKLPAFMSFNFDSGEQKSGANASEIKFSSINHGFKAYNSTIQLFGREYSSFTNEFTNEFH